MPTPSYDNKITEDTRELLMSQFRYKPVITAVLQTWTDKVQEVYEDLYMLMSRTLYMNAQGVNLHRYAHLLGLERYPLEEDYQLRERIVGEIMRRSSDGTPDRIRQIIEATTGMKKTRYFEHCSSDQQLRGNMGAFLIYGYQINTGKPMDIRLINGLFLKQASPATTGSVCLGIARTEESVFIPTEIISEPARLGVYTMQVIENENFERAGYRWVTTGDGVSFIESPEGEGQVQYVHASNTGGWHQTPQVNDTVMEVGRQYHVSVMANPDVTTTAVVECRLGGGGDWTVIPPDGTEVPIVFVSDPDPTVYFRAGNGTGGQVTLDWVSVADKAFIPANPDLDFLGLHDDFAPFYDDLMGYRGDNTATWGPMWLNGLAAELLTYSDVDLYVEDNIVEPELLFVDTSINEWEYKTNLQVTTDHWPGYTEHGYSLESSTHYQGEPTY